MARKFLFSSVAVVVTLAMVLAGCGGGDGDGEGIPYLNDGSFVQMSIGTIDSLDPAWGYDTSSGEQVTYLYDTLIYYAGGGTDEFEPRLATEWEFNNSTLEFRFHIRSGVTFHEGGTLTPEDVEYSFERAMVQDRVGGPAGLLFNPLLGVDSSTNWTAIDASVEVDGEWVVFTLDDAVWELIFLQSLTHTVSSIVDMSWCIDNGDWPGTEETMGDYHQPAAGTTLLHDQANGAGPWKLNLWEPGEQIKLEKFDDYWGDDVAFDWVITEVVEEWTNRKLALLAGEADFVDVDRQYMGELLDIDDLNKIAGLGELANVCMFFTWNITGDSPYLGSGVLDGEGIPPDFFSDEDVRKGFAYAMDYDTFIADAYLGEASQRGGPNVEGLLGFEPDRPMYSNCLTAAETHLQAAWGGDVWTNGFKMTLFYNVGNEARKTACNILSEALTDLNPLFQVSVQPVQWNEFLNGLFGSLYPIFVVGWGADYADPDNFFYPYMHSAGVFAVSQGYGNPTIDAKIVAASHAALEDRADLYSELEDIYYDEVPGLMLVQPEGRRFFTKYISGFWFNPMIPGDAGPLWDMDKSES